MQSSQAVQALTLSCALRVYHLTKVKVNSSYTPSAMLQSASRITGKVYKRGQYLVAAMDLTNWAHDDQDA